MFTQAGACVTQWGGSGSGNGQFFEPRGLAVGPDGAVYVADTFNNRIQRFTSDGTYWDQWGGLGTENGKFSWPEGIAVDSDGRVYVVDSRNCRIQVFGSDATPTRSETWGHLKTLYR